MKNISSETPIIISGITKGIYVVAQRIFRNLSEPKYIAIAPHTPIMTEIKLEDNPTIRELINVLQMWVADVKSCLYQIILNPVQVGDFDELKEKTINIIIGR